MFCILFFALKKKRAIQQGRRKAVGRDMIEVPLKGIDCYSRRNIIRSLPKVNIYNNIYIYIYIYRIYIFVFKWYFLRLSEVERKTKQITKKKKRTWKWRTRTFLLKSSFWLRCENAVRVTSKVVVGIFNFVFVKFALKKKKKKMMTFFFFFCSSFSSFSYICFFLYVL